MSKELNKAPVEQAGGDERVVDGKPRATKCPDCGEGDLMPGDLCACGYETDPAAGYACSECDGSGEGCVGEVCRECDGSGWFVTPEQARAALAQPSPAQAEQHWPKLEKPVQVGAIRFHAGLSSRLVVEAAQRLYEFESTPEKEAERIERLQAFREQCFEPLGTEFSKVLSDNLPDLLSTAQAERPEFDESEREDMARIAFETAMANGISLDSFTFLSNSLAERYERIVGELRADRDSWAEQVEQRLADWDEMRKERDAALAKIAELDQALAEKDPFGAKLNRISEKLERCDALLAARAAQAGQVPQAWLDVQAERRRQITAEGWTPEHDDLYCAAELPRAAAAYILNGANDEAPAIWSFSAKWWKPRDARSNYVRAGALILAEIERLDRAAPGKEVGHE
ncbi:hypothetical protein [Pseudomonas aeruginosa]|uniref:hypothetical protein n=2 Tax=Pseudomonas aeruginosa TaxID=287 RepID=UPI00071B52F1|nr:hypothetical protein [Pseudomonas aeruginosa]MCE2603162.1 hypothetical protein [Pseudomonas aeruginosa]MCS6532457.1 hypothetical protein [Pseudomonas aeruginosa]MCZ7806570.1 hypothetical protein [Pseudomonas aeruginosa]MDN3745708.1 hypothetical protein [Pseudomonas aeruginosa]MDN3856230.1 hypothetical protein [Pseudomonas aeruginosa]